MQFMRLINTFARLSIERAALLHLVCRIHSILFPNREKNIGKLDSLPGSLLLGLGPGNHVFRVWHARGLYCLNNLPSWGKFEQLDRDATERRFLIKSLLKMLMTQVGKHIGVTHFKNVDILVSLQRF